MDRTGNHLSEKKRSDCSDDIILQRQKKQKAKLQKWTRRETNEKTHRIENYKSTKDITEKKLRFFKDSINCRHVFDTVTLAIVNHQYEDLQEEHVKNTNQKQHQKNQLTHFALTEATAYQGLKQ